MRRIHIVKQQLWPTEEFLQFSGGKTGEIADFLVRQAGSMK